MDYACQGYINWIFHGNGTLKLEFCTWHLMIRSLHLDQNPAGAPGAGANPFAPGANPFAAGGKGENPFAAWRDDLMGNTDGSRLLGDFFCVVWWWCKKWETEDMMKPFDISPVGLPSTADSVEKCVLGQQQDGDDPWTSSTSLVFKQT